MVHEGYHILRIHCMDTSSQSTNLAVQNSVWMLQEGSVLLPEAGDLSLSLN